MLTERKLNNVSQISMIWFLERNSRSLTPDFLYCILVITYTNKFLLKKGVNGNISERHIEFERYSYNSKDFDDNSDLLDGNDEIVFGNLEFDEAIECKFDIERVVKGVQKHNNMLQISHDPGRYLCNYVYLVSNHTLGGQNDTDVAFLHVRDFLWNKKYQIPDNFDDIEIECQTVLQFIAKYAGQECPKLAYC